MSLRIKLLHVTKSVKVSKNRPAGKKKKNQRPFSTIKSVIWKENIKISLCLSFHDPSAFPNREDVWMCVHVKSLSRVRLCDTMDYRPPGSSVRGILQVRTLEWVAISFSSAWKCKVKVKSLSRVWLLATSWTAAYQAPPSMGFSRQECWSGVPLPSPGTV